MFRPHTAAFACLLLLLLLNFCFSSGKKSTKRDLPVETEWGSIEGLDTSCETIFIIYILEIITKESRKKKDDGVPQKRWNKQKAPSSLWGLIKIQSKGKENI